jgi:hypothetical protein
MFLKTYFHFGVPEQEQLRKVFIVSDVAGTQRETKAAPTLDTDMSRSDQTQLPDQISPGWCAYIDDRSCPAVWCHPLSVTELISNERFSF